MENLKWSALEYEEKNRSNDWFWALGVIIITISITSIIYHNYFLAVLIMLGGFMLGFFAKKPPEVITYELNSRGLKIKNSVYPYKNLKSFWVQRDVHEEGNVKPILFIKSERIFMPIMSIPIDEAIAIQIDNILTDMNVKTEEMHEHMSEKIMDVLGF